MMSNIHSNVRHSFVSQDDLILEFKTLEHHVIAFLNLPYLAPAPLPPQMSKAVPVYCEYGDGHQYEFNRVYEERVPMSARHPQHYYDHCYEPRMARSGYYYY